MGERQCGNRKGAEPGDRWWRLTLTWVACLTLVAAAAGAIDLEAYRWQHRLLVLAAPTATDPEVNDQLEMLKRRSDAVADRDLLLIGLYASGQSHLGERALSAAEARHLREQLDIDVDSSVLILIGKDGGIKRRTSLDTDLSEIFEQIDAMPMRRSEIREKLDQGLPVTRP